jgi:hypothetical protein
MNGPVLIPICSWFLTALSDFFNSLLVRNAHERPRAHCGPSRVSSLGWRWLVTKFPAIPALPWRAASRRSCRYLDRARPRHCCGGDHPVATRVNAEAEVAEEDDGLTRDCYNQGHDHGQCAVSIHLRFYRYLNGGSDSERGRPARSRGIHNVRNDAWPRPACAPERRTH